VQTKKGGKNANVADDPLVDIVFESSTTQRRKPRHADAAASAASEVRGSDSSSTPSSAPGAGGPSSSAAGEVTPKSAGWIGKTPVAMLRDWCAKNDRKQPRYGPMYRIPSGSPLARVRACAVLTPSVYHVLRFAQLQTDEWTSWRRWNNVLRNCEREAQPT
jgi:hypothetical protein